MWEKIKNLDLRKIRDLYQPERWKERWGDLDRNKKVASVAVLCSLVLLVYFLGTLSLRGKEFVPLITGLDPTEAADIVESLQEHNIPYRLDQEGTTILVAQEDVYETRLKIAGEGLLYGTGIGFELFDQTRLGATDFERRLNFQRALQEELRRTIAQIEEVEQARVHLVLPEPTVFIEETGDPSAAVFLRLHPMAMLEKEKIRSIVYLVAGSVENLKLEDVTVVDSQGVVLSDMLVPPDPALEEAEITLKQMEIQRVFERELEKRIQRVLERVYGTGKAVAMVTADLDFDAQESTAVIYGEGTFPRTETIIEEAYTGTGVAPGEVGVDANIPGYPWLYPGGDIDYERREEDRQFEIDEEVLREVRAPGRVDRLTAAVIIDDSVAMLNLDQAGITALVSSAIGIDLARGDVVTVQMLEEGFGPSWADLLMAEMERERAQRQMMLLIALGVVLAIILITAGAILYKRRKEAREAEEARLRELEELARLEEMARLEEEEELEELEEEEEGEELDDEELGEGEIPVEEILDEEEIAAREAEREFEDLRQKVKELVAQNPENVVQLLKTWLVED